MRNRIPHATPKPVPKINANFCKGNFTVSAWCLFTDASGGLTNRNIAAAPSITKEPMSTTGYAYAKV
ncbi:hypothetical protein [Nostoc sp. 'Lobaria pulmonaria (5183) cyanobiont']|uniref:hypothetical protein n=1 Tax=Nostoc sp. 'Lobaria pulmonaria (5183) cyanobiont' TaxID=1618022 RepID=UPI00131A0208|nr:hypothetical protein [Nostoc sp. 'Lobaria pulmonaria (5183) cyanobiont']